MAYSAPPPPDPYAAYRSQQTNGLAVASMVLGIVGVFFFIFFGIVSILAFVFGWVAIGQINRSGGRQGGKGMAVAGVVLGAIEIVIFVALIVAAANGGGHFYFHIGG